jgi:pyruvate dehydrogenase E2 component (dihydrolipoamide acetyltransferase)
MEFEIRHLGPVQKITSRNLHRAVQETAQITVHCELPADAVVDCLDRVNAAFAVDGRSRVTTTQAAIKCVAVALQDHPVLNAHFDGTSLKCFRQVHVGMAVSTDDGNLVVPVIRDAGSLTLELLRDRARDLALRAREGRLAVAELKGATFTVSSITGFAHALFATPIVAPPQVAILSVGALRRRPVVRDGDIVAGWILPVSLTIDHRPVNGAEATAFVETLAGILEKPHAVLGLPEKTADLQEEHND